MKRKTIGLAAVTVIVVSLVFVLSTNGCQKAMINYFAFHPEKGVQVDPDSLSAPVDTIEIETADGVKISGFYLRNDDEDRVLLYLHGNAGNASHRLHEAQRIWSMGLNVLLLDYRGYGLSEGSPSEEGVYEDAAAALAHLKKRGFTEDRIYVLGRSIGSAVAVELSQGRSFAGVILVSPFTSGRDMAARGGVGWILSEDETPFDSLSKISKLESPLMIIHGKNDELVPEEMGRALFEAANDPKLFVELKNAGHNDITQVEEERYFGSIEAFLKENTKQ